MIRIPMTTPSEISSSTDGLSHVQKTAPTSASKLRCGMPLIDASVKYHTLSQLFISHLIAADRKLKVSQANRSAS